MNTRIYVVHDKGADAARLVEAASAAAAVRHVAINRYTVTAASPKQIAHHMARGVHVETAGEKSPEQLEIEAAQAGLRG